MDLIGWVSALDPEELALLEGALASGRLRLNANASLLRSYGWPERWGPALGSLHAAGVTVRELELCAAMARQARSVTRPAVELVCTRPGASRVDVLDTSVAVRRLFTQAEREVLIAGFRVTDRDMLEPLRRPASRPLDVRLYVDLHPGTTVWGSTASPEADPTTWPTVWWGQFLDRIWPTYLDHPRCWYTPSSLTAQESGWSSMHAKVVVVDREVLLVTSANFTRRGHTRNLEIGTLVHDPARAAEVVTAFEEWTGAGTFAPCPP